MIAFVDVAAFFDFEILTDFGAAFARELVGIETFDFIEVGIDRAFVANFKSTIGISTDDVPAGLIFIRKSLVGKIGRVERSSQSIQGFGLRKKPRLLTCKPLPLWLPD